MVNGEWSDDELEASVSAYCDMLQKCNDGTHFVKKYYYKKLSSQFNRSEKAFEYRMQNISYVLFLMGRRWIPGLKPARNVGAKNAARIEHFLGLTEGRAPIDRVFFEASVHEILRKKDFSKPLGVLSPRMVTCATTCYQRNAQVKAWVIMQANGVCECCQLPAPFISCDGEPYLEVHHVRPLADGGADVVENTVALCPNCHKALHYGADAKLLIAKLLDSINRLKL